MSVVSLLMIPMTVIIVHRRIVGLALMGMSLRRRPDRSAMAVTATMVFALPFRTLSFAVVCLIGSRGGAVFLVHDIKDGGLAEILHLNCPLVQRVMASLCC